MKAIAIGMDMIISIGEQAVIVQIFDCFWLPMFLKIVTACKKFRGKSDEVILDKVRLVVWW